MKRVVTGALICSAVLAACGQQGDVSNSPYLMSRLSSLDEGDRTFSKRLDEMEARIAELEKNQQSPYTSVTIDPSGGEGYSFLNTNITPILVSFVDSSPVGDGTRIRLKIGNVSTARLLGAEFRILYGPREPISGAEREAWSAKLRFANQKIADDLAPATWTEVSISLPGIKPDQLGYLNVHANLDQLSLYTRR